MKARLALAWVLTTEGCQLLSGSGDLSLRADAGKADAAIGSAQEAGEDAPTDAQPIGRDETTEAAMPSDGEASTPLSTVDSGDDRAVSPDGTDTDAEGGDDTADTGSPPDADVGIPNEAEASPPSGCPTGHGPTMVVVSTFCIDSTEVTSAQYNDFLLTTPSVSGQPTPECSWNSSYLPGNGWSFDSTQGTLPIASVDWCDAYAFCKWAGKRLCGKVGGGAADFSKFAGTENEHYMACSSGSNRIYPYGNTFMSTACNGAVDQQVGHAVPVASLLTCQGGVQGLFDMSGNVEEWQDACSGNSGADDQCLNGTGAFDYTSPASASTRCDFADSDTRNGQFSDVGFRCCATLP
jgi:formylglycine-generating enzyme required for sulfatase activity